MSRDSECLIFVVLKFDYKQIKLNYVYVPSCTSSKLCFLFRSQLSISKSAIFVKVT